eukprot:s3307_g6.t2
MKTGVEFIACAAAGRTAQEMATIHPRLAADLSSTPKQVQCPALRVQLNEALAKYRSRRPRSGKHGAAAGLT